MAHPNSPIAPATYVRKNQETPVSLRSYIFQGAIWMGVMMSLFYVAGLRF